MLRQFHDGMQARVALGGGQSDYFNVEVSVKQGCILGPVLFNVFLVAVTLLSRYDLKNGSIQDNQLRNTEKFTYLGSIISSNGVIGHEIQNRIHLASSAFGRLKDGVLLNRVLNLSTQIEVYRAVVLSMLLFASETWTCQTPRILSYSLSPVHSSSDLERQDPTYRDPGMSEIDQHRMYDPQTSNVLGGACYQDAGKPYTQDCPFWGVSRG
ncbi:uncharacterized protein LOC118767649 [Octopus sinensis]|uniref:Uncharacterized protein LOC118767649 n=1 Tax=Octopus sinensis TaxID=2607531 RepID=A0A7E6FLZ9_9MOLL|nr:uncharacterized protein LOC118767649 [Octopus sinensis]